MDLTETALNLRDIHPNTEIILLTGSEGWTATTADMDPIVRALPETQVLSASDLSRYLATPDGQAAPPKRRAVENDPACPSASTRRDK